ncbi:MAG TPA: DUF4159 domain-containing protein [Humisphaera sp.]
MDRAHADDPDTRQTYAVALRAATLSVHRRPQDMDRLRADAVWLRQYAATGFCGYGLRRDRGRWVDLAMPGHRDNSNSQFALMGVWMAADAGVEVPLPYWAANEAHWARCQSADGTWNYYARPEVANGALAMTCAGVASLVVAADYQHAARPPREFASPHRPLDRGIAWLESGDNAYQIRPRQALGPSGWGYDLFSVERVGLATGFKYLGDRDWYRHLAAQVIADQRENGGWGYQPPRDAPPPSALHAAARAAPYADLVDTSFAVLFLARGRHPVMASKLRYDGAWNNRPRDLAGAARFVAGAVERPLNWQVVNLRKPGTDWLEAPVLYVSGHEPPPLTDADYAKVADYVRWGGMVFLHADGGSASFRRWAAETFVPKVCPGRALADLPPGHPLRDVAYKLPAASVPLAAVTNGSRVLVVLSPDDHAGAWQTRDEVGKAPSFRLVANVFAYATGNVPPRNRLDTPFVPEPAADPLATFAVARVTYGGGGAEGGGDWDPEPGAWPRFARVFRWETGAAVDARPTAAAAMSDVAPAGVPLAHQTGTAAADLTAAEAAGLRSYVERGGVLLVDACGGSAEFADAVERRLLPAAFPGMSLAPADPAAPPLARTQAVTDDLTQGSVRPYAAGRVSPTARPLLAGRFGRGWVVFSRLDLTTGLLGTNVWGVNGYSPAYAKGVVKNLLVWAATARGDPR